MSTYTEQLQLRKPAGAEAALILEHFNGNWDKLDAFAKAILAAVQEHTDNTENPHLVGADQIETRVDGMSAITVQSALAELLSAITALNDNAQTHTDNTNNPHNVTAEQVSVSAEGIIADTVQAALTELQSTITTLRGETFGLGTTIPEAADLDTYTTPGTYCSPTASRSKTLINSPTSAYGFRLEVRTVVGGRFVQILTPNAAGVFYMRSYLSAGWSNWYKFSGEEIIPTEEASV